MRTVLFVHGAGNGRGYAEDDFPVAVGVTPDGDAVFGDGTNREVVAWLGLSGGALFIEPVVGTSAVRLAQAELTESAWVSVGGVLEVGKRLFLVASDAGSTVLEDVTAAERPVLTPPVTPPETPAGSPQEPPLHGPADMLPESVTPAAIAEVLQPPDDESGQESDEPPLAMTAGTAPLPGSDTHSRALRMVLAVFGFLVLCVGFVLVAAPVRIAVEPPVDSISFSGFPPPIKIAERYLVVPGTYRLTAEKEGYRVLEDAIDVTFGSALELQYQMVRLPGLLDVNSIPVSGAEITIDGRVVGDTPLKSVELEAGPHDVRIAKERYLPDSESIEIRGMGDRQAIELSLEPGWATVLFQTEPPGAEVWVDNDLAGTTPAVLEPMGGSHEIELRLTGWKSVSQHLTVEPGETIERPVVVLAKLDGVLELTSVPAGASVTFNEVFRGQTPLTLTVTSEVDHRISLSKEGFATLSESVRVERSETRSLNLRLKQEFGIVFVSAEPPGAQLEVDGKSMGSASRRLTLSTRAHRLKVTKPGYVTFSTTVTPSQSESRTVTVKLKSEAVVKEELLARPTATAAGQLLNRILLRGPTLVRMGASRREAGRRGNESQRSIELTRSFFVSQKEVTNAEFKKFKARHDSGVEAGLDLTEDDQPAASVTWDDAARYLNWLSDKESLPRAYKEDNGKMVAVVPVRTGYRFPTEAEWAFLARYEGGTRSDADRLKYPWGNTLSPPVRSGNYADSSMAGSFSRVIPGYIDDHRVAAPVGSFPPNSSGLYDIGGNVSEWCHDYYDVYSVASPTVAQDPTGPVNGKYHVIRGSSWRHGGITELRFSYRDYSAGSRNDLGFRIARYADK